MTNKTLIGIAIALGLRRVFGRVRRARAGIPAGWSVDIKPKRAILSYAPEADGPRHLIVACLRDSEEIGIYSTGIGAPSSKPVVGHGADQCGAEIQPCAATWAWTT